jgi:hypothetical protein
MTTTTPTAGPLNRRTNPTIGRRSVSGSDRCFGRMPQTRRRRARLHRSGSWPRRQQARPPQGDLIYPKGVETNGTAGAAGMSPLQIVSSFTLCWVAEVTPLVSGESME